MVGSYPVWVDWTTSLMIITKKLLSCDTDLPPPTYLLTVGLTIDSSTLREVLLPRGRCRVGRVCYGLLTILIGWPTVQLA